MLESPRPAVGPPSLARQKAALWFAFAIILFVSALAFISMQRLIALGGRVEHRQSILLETSRFLSGIKDVETGGRGYYLTGDGLYLTTQQDGIASTRSAAARLRSLQDDVVLARQIDRLIIFAEWRIRLSRRLVAERGSPDAASLTIAAGTSIMGRINAAGDAIIASEAANYRAEREGLERQTWLTSIALALGVILCLATIAWLFSLRGRELERRRQLEEELRALNLELEDRVQERTSEVKRARDLLTAVVENLPDMILLKEPSGDSYRYLLVNAAGERLLGRDRSEILGKTERDLFPPGEATAILDANRSVAESGKPRILADRKLTTATGVRTVETRMVPIMNGSGSLGLMLAIIRDVTEVKAREDQLRQLQRMDAIGRLTGGVAHDFNNLLAIIHGNAELLGSQLDGGSEAAEMADDVVGAATRGAELVRRLLAFARMQHLEPEPLDLNARLPGILGLLQRSLGETVKVRIKPAKRLWSANVDPTQVDDAIVNLAINARDAMPGGGTLTIETQNVTLDDEYAAHHVEVSSGDYVMLAVSDTGTGMPPDVIARAFEPFFTTKEEGQGTGLGLSQIFGWIKQSGGHIKIYSELGHGSTIKLYLPRAKATRTEEAPRVEAGAVTGNETILVVEDNPNVRKTVIRQLHDLGYQTAEAESGASALQLVRNGAEFDLLLTDVVMPGGMTGYQLADELRQARPSVRVLFTSGYTELAASTDGVSRQDPLLSKPYRKQDLGRAVRAALDVAKSAKPD